MGIARFIVAVVTIVGVVQVAAAAQVTFDTLRKEHPRVLVTGEDFDRLKEKLKVDPVVQQWYGTVQRSAEAMLKEPPVKHELIGPRLLDKSRKAFSRISTLAGMYRLTGDARYRDRAIQEMEAVCAFADWNPSHFLDVAEMTTAVAVGYDWLYDAMDAKQREGIRQGLIRLGLREGLKAYGESGQKPAWWVNVNHNWNQVCNGGLLVGALAIADESPDLAEVIATHATDALPKAMHSFAPDGGWAEGPGYWNYATQYNVYALATLETALGKGYGLAGEPGFAQTGLFRMRFIGPSGLAFNYADAGEKPGEAPQMFWLARKFDQPEYAAQERARVANPSILDLLWYDGRGSWPDDAISASGSYKGVNVAFLSGAWSDASRVWVGVKGGDNRANHSHLDLGTFCLDYAGQRFVEQLGPDDYNLPGYFGKQRWTYYRLRTEGQNTLVIDGENQQVDAKAKITNFTAGRDAGQVMIDLDDAYRGRVSSWTRVIRRTGSRVEVEDKVAAAAGKEIEVVWGIHTPAKVEVAENGESAVLEAGGKRMVARLKLPTGAKFVAQPVEIPAPQKPVKGVTKLMVKMEKVKELDLVVLFEGAK